MLDFLLISVKPSKGGGFEIYPKFIVRKSSDLMIRGGDFYAIWVADRNMWSMDEDDATKLIDHELDLFAEEQRGKLDGAVKVRHIWDAENGMIDRWHKFCKQQMRDNYHMLDEKLIFSNTNVQKEDYASKRLNYPLGPGDISAYDHLMSVLYSEEERKKIEWAIGSIVSGDSKTIQKFLVLYGAAGTGKSTVLNIVQQLFEGYYSVFDAKSLGSSNNAFALEAFNSNPLVAIQHDGDLSRIEDNTRLNSLVSHELMTVNEKFKTTYSNSFKAFLFMGTNKPVKITDAKSGLMRRLIDVTPSGDKLSPSDYKSTTKKIKYELGAIAQHCLDVYKEDPGAYDDYIPTLMLGASNDFYNFVEDSYSVFLREDGTTLKAAWEMYKAYCEEAKIAYPFTQRVFKEELKNYFDSYSDRLTMQDGSRPRNLYSGFKTSIFENPRVENSEKQSEDQVCWIIFEEMSSLFDEVCKDCLAQEATKTEKPRTPWAEVKTTLKDIDTSKVHYVKVPENHIVIDFDIPDENGNKSYEKNLEAASKWPKTYAELSKSGAGIHLHYIYTGDPKELSSLAASHVEIKVFTGGSSLRRKLTKCNDIPIATISSGLPLRERKMLKKSDITNERELKSKIEANLKKKIHPDTRSSCDYINKLLNDAYEAGFPYDLTEMYNDVFAFAARSTNQSKYCMNLVKDMKFKSKGEAERIESNEDIIFFDVEVMPNLVVICYKKLGEQYPVVKLINPTQFDVEQLLEFRLIGFNNLNYDNHILHALLLGYDPPAVYDLSRRIIEGDKTAQFRDAKNHSYTDIFDFSSDKKSLKKFEIELGIHHQELGLPWDQPVPEELWQKVADYCANDVLATEALFLSPKRQADWTARQILADVADMVPNNTTNNITTRIIFSDDRYPQHEFNYRNMGDVSAIDEGHTIVALGRYLDGELFEEVDKDYTKFDSQDRPIFPGYIYDSGVSTYRGEKVGEGGYVYSEPGIYSNIALLDIASMHPSSIVAENLFGDRYTKRFKDILDARIAIKHGDFEHAKTMLDGKLAPYLDDESKAGDLAQALKIAINSVYGLTSAKFDNPFRDIRNKDNIVAKRGALFMINLKHEVQKRGFKVAHIKTDSIKIPDATPDIISFVMEYGKLYGYNFEHEATYDRMCLVNDAVYIARYAEEKYCEDTYGYIPEKNGKKPGKWTATGTQFQVPYVFKSLFSKEPIEFSDLCETKEVKKGEIYIDMNENLVDVSGFEKELSRLEEKYKHGKISDTFFEPEGQRLTAEIAKGHNYVFVGRVGSFCPMKPGAGGGILYRKNDGKYYAVTGTKNKKGEPYRWLESEMVEGLSLKNDINEDYYISLANDAIDTISKYGDFERFVDTSVSYDFMNEPEELPFN